jgi:CRP-like cAMP-binding protein
LAAKYERDAAVLEASRRVMTEITRLEELTEVQPELAEECRQAYEEHGTQAMERIDAVAEHFPEFVRAVQQQTAQRIALDGEADAAERLAATGLIPGTIARETRAAVKAAQRDLQRHPVAVLQPNPEDLLSRVPFFQNLAPADFERLVDTLVPRTVLAGETILRQGDRGTSLFLIARGVVAVLIAPAGGAPQRVASLHAGDFFGEMALLTAERRTATVRAVTDCHLYELSKPDVDALCDVCAGVREALMEAYRARKGGERA